MKLAPPTMPTSLSHAAHGSRAVVSATQDQATRLRAMMEEFALGREASEKANERANEKSVAGANPYYTPPAPLPTAIDTHTAHVRHAAGALAPVRETSRDCVQVRPCAVPVIAITSGKGGVGKTSVAVNLAAAFAMKSLRVTLVDADLGLANADVLCGLSPVTRLDSVVESGPGKRSIRQIAVDAPGGFKLVPGAVGLSRMANLPEDQRHELLDALADIERETDLVILDTGAGVGDNVMGFVRHADLSLIVVTPEPTSIADAYALIKVHRMSQPSTAHLHAAVLVNQARNEQEAIAVHARIAATAKKFLGVHVPLVGWLHHDAAMPASVRARGPVVVLHPKAKVTADVCRLTRALANNPDLRLANNNQTLSARLHASADRPSLLRRVLQYI